MIRGLGVSKIGQKIALLYRDSKEPGKVLVAQSQDGFSFGADQGAVSFLKTAAVKFADETISNIRVADGVRGFFITFTAEQNKALGLYAAAGSGLLKWKNIKHASGSGRPATVVPDYVFERRKIAYIGNDKIYIAAVSATKDWQISKQALLEPRKDFFDDGRLTVGQARVIDEGIAVTYYSRRQRDGNFSFAVGAALFDSSDPAKLLWRSDYPLWEQPERWEKKELYLIGECELDDEFLVFWGEEKTGEIFCVKFTAKTFPEGLRYEPRHHPLALKRHEKNPILKPKPENAWESKAAFNPAAFYAEGRVHLIYRAIGDTDMSVFGYASSADGLHFDQRLNEPIYTPRKSFEGASLKIAPDRGNSPFMSGGGGWGGCEDPRVSLIGDKLYMTYVAFDGANPPRVALTSIALQDFLNHYWRWKEPVLISPYLAGEGNKNACILPETVNGKYVIFHRLFPDILLDYVDDLDFDGQTKWLSRGHHRIKPSRSHWDSRKIGAGATPIKTDEGWLMIYQAVGYQDPSQYKIGAMLLDLEHPEKVIARSAVPILQPEAWYENEGWKYGVAYPCGAAKVGDDLFVYYGGADTYTCAAKTYLPDFLKHLLRHQPGQLNSVAL